MKPVNMFVECLNIQQGIVESKQKHLLECIIYLPPDIKHSLWYIKKKKKKTVPIILYLQQVFY